MNVALIGYGYWGKIIEKYIRDKFTLKKILVRNTTEQMGCCFTEDISDILSDSTIKAVFVCTPIDTHFDICKDLLLSGKHVFCEKPTVKTSEQLDELLEISYSKNIVLYTDYIYTNSPSINNIRLLLNTIGNIEYICGEISQFGNFYKNDSVDYVLTVHLLSILPFIYDKIIVNDCIKSNTNTLNKYIQNITLNINDNININFITNMISNEKTRTIKFYGTNGSVIFDMMNSEYKIQYHQYEKDGYGFSSIKTKILDFDESNNLQYAINDFYKIVDNNNNTDNIRISKFVCDILDRLNNKLHS